MNVQQQRKLMVGTMLVVLFAAACTSAATPTPTSIPVTPTPTLVLATSAAEIVGVWLGEGSEGLYHQFNPDGTLRIAAKREALDTNPDVECTYLFDGTNLLMTQVKAAGLPPCSMQTGTYKVEVLDKDRIRFIRVLDSCGQRVASTARVHERVP